MGQKKNSIINYASKISLILSNLWIFMPTGKIAPFLLVADIERIVCHAPAGVYPLWYRSIDLSTNPGLKSHLINISSLEGTAAST
jgi:hypothetical protein